MSLPTEATAAIEIAAPVERVYDLTADVTCMGAWSLARWSTIARVLDADRPRRFAFATLHRGRISTRWTYELAGDQHTELTESFESVTTPWAIGLVERWFDRDGQAQLESGMAHTLAAMKTVAEASDGAGR